MGTAESLAALRFIRACFKNTNNFIHRPVAKQDLIAPLLALLEEESRRDNMLITAAVEILDIIRKVNVTPPYKYTSAPRCGHCIR